MIEFDSGRIQISQRRDLVTEVYFPSGLVKASSEDYSALAWPAGTLEHN
jgi:hypothetical protein